MLGTIRDHPWLLLLVLILVNALSWVDGLLTLAEISTGIAREGNPFLAAAFERHPLLAVGIKGALVFALTVMTWQARNYRIILAMSLVALGVFAAVVAYHVGSLHGFGLI